MTRLLLFDIDLTLIQSSGGGRLAMNRALAGVTGVAEPTEGVRFDGRTDRGIFMEVLGRYVERPSDVIDDAMARYLEELPAALAEKPGTVLGGVPALLEALDGKAALGLASGNMARGAKLKLDQFELWEHFRGGGFGDHAEARHELIRDAIADIARNHECAPDPANSLVIGDTPRDVEAAHTAGARALGVATGRYSVEELLAAGAELAVEDLRDTRRVTELLLG